MSEERGGATMWPVVGFGELPVDCYHGLLAPGSLGGLNGIISVRHLALTCGK